MRRVPPLVRVYTKGRHLRRARWWMAIWTCRARVWPVGAFVMDVVFGFVFGLMIAATVIPWLPM